MADFDPSAPADYNSMQQQAGLLPPPFQPPPVIFPGQVSAAMAQGGPSAVSFLTQGSVGTSFGAGMFPGQQLQGFTNQSPMYQGPTGVMMPMNPGAQFGAYAGSNPYAGLAARGPYQGAPGLFTPMAPQAPPVYAGQMAQMGAFMPPPADAQFNTSYSAGFSRDHIAAATATSHGWAGAGLGARIGADAMGGLAGAMLGRRFGGVGAVLGGLAGFMGVEMAGGGAAAQNTFMNQVAAPALNQRGIADGIESMSRSFITSGPEMHARGAGFTHHAAADVARGLKEMAGSSSFQTDTGGRFNQQDLLKITQEASRNDMMTGVQSASQMTSRVRDIAKSLTSFMQLAQEPDVVRAIQTMGQLRASGLNLTETNRAVSQGRTFARMAGMSFADLMDQGGAVGSQTYQAMGLTQGLGLHAGMANFAMARGTQNAGGLSPQMMNLLGGAGGYANMNNVFGASMLQMPMLAPSVMSSSGGISTSALQGLISGQTNPMSQTSQAASALSSITSRSGIGGLGMAIAMQPQIQDTIGRVLQSQGPFAQRNFEDRNVMGLMRQMGLSGSGGMATALQMMGANASQANARAQELASPGYYERQRQQIEVQRREGRQAEMERWEAESPSLYSTMARSAGFEGDYLHRAGHALHGALGGDHHTSYAPTTDQGMRDDQRRRQSAEGQAFGARISSQARAAGTEERGFASRWSALTDIQRGRGRRGLGILAGVGIYGLMPGREHADNMESELRDYREGARLTGQITGATARDTETAMASTSQRFGAGAATGIQNELANRIVNRADGTAIGGNRMTRGIFNFATNALASTGVSRIPVVGMIAGMALDIGQTQGDRAIGGNFMRTAIVDALMHNAHMSREEATAEANAHPERYMQLAAQQIEQRGTPEQKAALRANTQNGGMGARAAPTERMLRRSEGQARRGLFGSDSAEYGDAFQAAREHIRGTGREGSAENAASRNYILAQAALVTQSQRVSSGSPEQAHLQRQMDTLARQAQARGVNTSAADVTRQVGQASEELSSSAVNRGAARAFTNVGGDLMQRLNEGAGQLSDVRNTRRISGGIEALAGRGTAFSAALRRILGDKMATATPEDVINAAKQMRPEELSTAPEHVRQALRGMNRTDDRSVAATRSAVTEQLYNTGGRREHLEQEYDSSQGVFGRIGRFLHEGAYNEGRERHVQESLYRSTEADAAADASNDNTNALQAAAGALGIGGGNDAMVTAARDIRAAAEALQGAVSSGGLPGLINPNP